jgi:hypothetical protein
VSKEFRLRHSQVLAGVLEDPAGYVLPGIELHLLSGHKIIQQLRTSNQGEYHFAEIPPGKYRLQVQHGGNSLCAPKVQCGTEGCTFKPRLTLNPKNMVRVD